MKEGDPITTEIQDEAVLRVLDDLLSNKTKELQATIDGLASLVRDVEGQLQDRDAELSLVHRVAEVATAYAGSADVHRRIIEEALDATQADNASIFLYHHDEGLLKPYVARGTKDAAPRQIGFKPGTGIAGRVFADRRPMFIADTAQSPEFDQRSGEVSVRSLLCLPLEVRGEAIGVLNLSHREPGFFSPDHERVFMILAHQTAAAIKHCLLHEHLRDQVARIAEAARLLEPLAARLPSEAVELINVIGVTADQLGRIVDQLQNVRDRSPADERSPRPTESPGI